ncbi:MAG: tetratricopeptide repeat protein, partial [Pseudomonadota bacterium]|nr:tetratricopeptide repeat protein [Pseudomonadota bacterium]
DYGRAMAKAGKFEIAIAALKTAPDQDDPRVLNYLGYSHRKLGRMDNALGYYRAAVAKDPDFSLVREYLGEAYIQLGLLEKAREQLSEIERICGSKTCSEYGQLANLIVEHQIRAD